MNEITQKDIDDLTDVVANLRACVRQKEIQTERSIQLLQLRQEKEQLEERLAELSA